MSNYKKLISKYKPFTNDLSVRCITCFVIPVEVPNFTWNQFTTVFTAWITEIKKDILEVCDLNHRDKKNILEVRTLSPGSQR
jgi:hypothetical protein